MSKDEARAIFKHGQALLDAVHGHLTTRGLEDFDRMLGNLYDNLDLQHGLCVVCDADVPTILMEDECPNCGG